MVLEKLDIDNLEEIEFFKQLFMDSFPHSERRPLNLLFGLYRDNPHFTIAMAKYEGKTVGLFCYWDLDEFIFGEYLAIDPNLRNGGYGKKVIDRFVEDITKPVILEVELPTTILSERRIGFYQRLGFKLWENIQYQQPAYHEDTQPVPMKLMSLGDIDLESNISNIRTKLYTAVYDC